ncbi:sterol desaturase family protein [Neolewinella antarctica]|uniref:Sterol desaturase/sphingolipid hydroxylase (Fatty acid hydroxylase superfamily) n=1 Tax=Neolewinella antarctica TaxID=442734 RepID=A0ABX0XEX3_9BACT|nr:sterol desaturase family protein [Neolewinella antarctica]NJC27434.1 sterol desaturase/sphingolipid hydroxylase (fatty acid hydroxylase superfamily) [Neolewinella antarctica]
MPEFIFTDNPLAIHYAIPAFVVLLLLEIGLAMWDGRDSYDTKDTISSLAMGVGNAVIRLFTKIIVIGVYFFLYQYRLFDLGYAWWVWVLCFFVEDLAYYAFHRSSHEIRYFWASHVVHHSSQRYNLSTALRQTWTGSLSGAFLFSATLALIGFHPIMIAIFGSVSLIYQFWIHTELIDKLWAPLEYVFNTPSHHRVHHGSDVKYLDRNHGGVLIIWDRLFGTFTPEEERPTYGLVTNIKTHNPLRIATHEWAAIGRDLRHAPDWRSRLGYLFGPPGWSHDGSRRTSKQLQADEADNTRRKYTESIEKGQIST